MITEIFLRIITFFLQVLTWFIPNWNLPGAIYDFIGYSVELLFKLDFIIPVDEFFEYLAYIMWFEILYLGFKLAGSFVSYIRGGGKLDI